MEEHFFSFFKSRRQTHRHSGDGGDEGIDKDGRRLAVVLWSRVWLGVGFVIAEEALDVHGERVRVLKVVRQQNGPCHDDQLEIKHIGSSFRIGSTGECRSWERKDSRKEKSGKCCHGLKKGEIFPSQSKMIDAPVMCKMNQVCMER